ncbi:MAG: helix-turn-helix domain-containing protein [Planctomycetia bacterium]|nr:helix-turn-helix domain-containing protein [Planctomycetia bacterium]
MSLFHRSGPSTANDGQLSVASHTSPALLDVRAVAELLGGCSTRHVYRLSDGGKMPPPVRLGALVRWSKPTLDAWLAGGCKAVRTVASKGGSQ